jgi:hypothetical protein
MNKIIYNTLLITVAGCLCLMSSALLAQENEARIDWDKARTLLQKQRNGQELTPEERAYLEHASQLRRRGGSAGGGTARVELTQIETLLIKRQLGRELTDEEKAQVERARQTFLEGRGDAHGRHGRRTVGESTPVKPKPLIEMSAQDTYKGETGGLYGAGHNMPHGKHQAAAEKAIAQMRLLDDKGQPDSNGKIVLLSIGMSNTTQEFSFFKRLADQSPLKNRQIVIVDAAQGGRDADDWTQVNTTDRLRRQNVWEVAAQRLQAAGVTPQQVQAIWVKHALRSPSGIGEHPAHTRRLQKALQEIAQIAREQFPNLRVAYLSSRTYAGYAASNLNPEPYAYESAFAVRRLIQDQMAGKPELNYDSAKGAVKAPVLLWGPYLWADGTTARADNGLVWAPEDFVQDGTHPSPFGRAKVAGMLYDYFTTSPLARSWFVNANALAKDQSSLDNGQSSDEPKAR